LPSRQRSQRGRSASPLPCDAPDPLSTVRTFTRSEVQRFESDRGAGGHGSRGARSKSGRGCVSLRRPSAPALPCCC
jgi:hypothetical protein